MGKHFYAARIYLHYNDPIENNIKIEKIVKFIKGSKLIIAINSYSRSTIWYDVLTKSREKR